MKRLPALIASLACLVAACQSQGRAGFVSVNEPAEDYTATSKAQLAEQLARWRALSQRDYTIVYEFVEDTTKPAIVTRRYVAIRNNSVLDTRCAIGSCPTTFLKDLRLVPELFELIATLPAECMDQVQFNREYHYPEFVSANCTGKYSKPFTIRVAGFAPGA